MRLIERLLTNNNCYKSGKRHAVKGIMVHSTGANNPWLKRYVAPNDGILGQNSYNTHWNQEKPGGINVCVHAFIGKVADGTIATYQTLPWDMVGWHSGSGSLGSSKNANNNGYIGFEICEDGLTDATYFNKVYNEAVELCIYLCKKYGLTEKNIICHSEGYRQGIASNHADVMHWFPKHGKSMDTFRADVKKGLATPIPAEKPTMLYRVKINGTQKSAYGVIENAQKDFDARKESLNIGDELYVERSTDGYKEFYYKKEAPKPTIDYEKELIRVIADGKQVVVLTGYTKCLNHATTTYGGKTVILECIKDGKKWDLGTIILPTPPKVENPPIEEEPSKEVEKPTDETPIEKNPICGESKATATQMATLLLKNNLNPKIHINPIDFCQLYLDEGKIENIRGDVAFCQSIHETGWFKFTQDVTPEQNNFAGIGTTGGGVKGAYFKDAKEGIQAQIQHLKAYATTEKLVNDCVDPRFNLVKRGIAPNWEDLNGRWAVPGTTYGQSIIKLYEKLKDTKEDMELLKPYLKEEKTEEPKKENSIFIEFLIKLVKFITDFLSNNQ